MKNKLTEDSSKEPLLLNPAPILDLEHEIVQEHAAPELSVHYKQKGVKQSFSMQMQKIFVPNEEDKSKGGKAHQHPTDGYYSVSPMLLVYVLLLLLCLLLLLL